jgi:hypothetical protein
MAILTIATQLEEVQTAITAVMAGQSFTLDGVTFTRASLSSLQQREEYLQNQYAKSSAGNRPFMKTVNFSGMGYS